jgi:hypothetical protein
MISTNFPDAPSDVIQYFSKMRVLMRIQHLNRRVEDAKFQLQEQRRLEFLKSRGAFLDEDDPMEERPDELVVLENDLAEIEQLIESGQIFLPS